MCTFAPFNRRGFTLIKLMICGGTLSLLFALAVHRLHHRALHSMVGGTARQDDRYDGVTADLVGGGITSTFVPSGAVTPAVVFVNPKFYDDPPDGREAPTYDDPPDGRDRPAESSRLDGGVCVRRANVDDNY